jgi:hypothetical protein
MAFSNRTELHQITLGNARYEAQCKSPAQYTPAERGNFLPASVGDLFHSKPSVQFPSLAQTGSLRSAEHVRSARVFQTSTCSAIARTSSTLMPRYLTVLSILVCPSRSWTALRLPVRR